MSSPAPSPRRVFVDTGAYFALADPRDENHAATAILPRLPAQRWRVSTSNFVLAETHALLLARRGRTSAARILAEIDHSTAVQVRVSAADERRAREIITTYQDKDFSLTDATSFAIMERLRISHAFTFDRHFAQYGFTVLEP